MTSLAKSILNPSVRRRVEHGLVTLALVMFCIHLGLYGLGHLGALDLPASLFSHPLQSLYTPFSIILIAEVYLLVYYLPTSFARSLGKQIEIVALIEIRSVFKDLDTTSNWPWEAAFFPHLLSAMVLGASASDTPRSSAAAADPRSQTRSAPAPLAAPHPAAGTASQPGAGKPAAAAAAAAAKDLIK